MREIKSSKQKNMIINMNTDMDSMFNNFRIKIHQSGHAVCDSTWGAPEFSSSSTNTHIKAYAHLYYITAGSGSITYNNTTVDLIPGTLYFIPPFLKHTRSCEYMEQFFIHANIFAENSPDSEDIFKNCQRIISLPHENIEEMVKLHSGNKFSDFFKLHSLLMNDIAKIITEYDFDIQSNLAYNAVTNRTILYIKENLSTSLESPSTFPIALYPNPLNRSS